MKSVRDRVIPAVAAGLMLFLAQSAAAAVDCTASANGVAFGTYDPLAAAADDSTGTVTVSCSYSPPGANSVNYAVTLSTGRSGSFTQRYLAAGASSLGYNVFSNAGRSQVWGDASLGSVVITGSFTFGSGQGDRTRLRTHTIYGRIPALQDVPPGNYTDSVVVTLTF